MVWRNRVILMILWVFAIEHLYRISSNHFFTSLQFIHDKKNPWNVFNGVFGFDNFLKTCKLYVIAWYGFGGEHKASIFSYIESGSSVQQQCMQQKCLSFLTGTCFTWSHFYKKNKIIPSSHGHTMSALGSFSDESVYLYLRQTLMMLYCGKFWVSLSSLLNSWRYFTIELNFFAQLTRFR